MEGFSLKLHLYLEILLEMGLSALVKEYIRVLLRFHLALHHVAPLHEGSGRLGTTRIVFRGATKIGVSITSGRNIGDPRER